MGRRNNQELFYILGGGKVGAPSAPPRASGTGAAARSNGPSGASSNTGPRQAAGSNTGPRQAAAAGGVPRAGAAAAGGASSAKVKELETTV
mmetsp:Transcript_5171/g.6343  ORF Transcript_5171/g.6343 Transcript_5171/m.6343 type:complete len:91 (-) Transcript_5171:814-1086(-)